MGRPRTPAGGRRRRWVAVVVCVAVLSVLAALVAQVAPASASQLTAAAAAVRAAPAPYLMFGTQFHGTWGDYTDAARDQVLTTLKDNGAATVRIDVSWAMLEPTASGQFDPWGLSVVDNAIKRASAKGLRPLVTLWMAPQWANGSTNTRVAPTSDAGLAALTSVATRLAARYDPRIAGNPNGTVDAWEVWNEPNDPDFLAGTTAPPLPAWAPAGTPALRTDPAVYAKVLAAAYKGFKAHSPATTVVFGGVSGTDDVWIDAALAAGARGYYDVMAVHPYMAVGDASPDTADSGNLWTLRHLPAVLAAMSRYGEGAKPVWFTEFGWRAHATTAADANWQRGVSPTTQAAYLSRTLELTRALYPSVARAYWYSDRATAAAPGAPFDPAEAGYGLVYPDGTASPALKAVKAATFASGCTADAGGTINLFACGAVADGVTDNADRIQAALSSLPPGGRLVVPPTAYGFAHSVESSYTHPGWVLTADRAGTTISGAAPGAPIDGTAPVGTLTAVGAAAPAGASGTICARPSVPAHLTWAQTREGYAPAHAPVVKADSPSLVPAGTVWTIPTGVANADVLGTLTVSGATSDGSVALFDCAAGYNPSGPTAVSWRAAELAGGASVSSEPSRSTLRLAAANVTVADLLLRTDTGAGLPRRADYEHTGLHLAGADGAVVRRVTVDGPAAAGVHVSATRGFTLAQVTVRNTGSDGIHMTEGSSGGTVTGAVTDNTGDDGISVVSYADPANPTSAAGTVRDITITDSTVASNRWGRGFSVVGGSNITMRNITASSTAGAGLFIGAESVPGAWLTQPVTGVSVDGAAITGANYAASHPSPGTSRSVTGAVLVVSDRPGAGVSNVSLSRLTVAGTDPAGDRSLAVMRRDDATLSGVSLSSVAVSGGPSTVGKYLVERTATNPEEFPLPPGELTTTAVTSQVGAPSGLAAVSPSTTSASLTFTAGNASGWPVYGYEYSFDGGATWSAPTPRPGLPPTAFAAQQSTSPITLTGLKPGTSYTAVLRTVANNGRSAASAPATFATAPAGGLLPAGGVLTVHTGAKSATVLGNLTVAGPAGAGWAVAYPCDQPRPLASNINFAAGQTVASFVAVRTDPAGDVCVYATAATHLVWDETAETSLPSHAAVRKLDTRGPAGASARPAAGTTTRVATGARPGQTVLGTLTVTQAAAGGFATVFPCASGRPNASNINFTAGQTLAVGAVVVVDTAGDVCIYSNASVHVLWDQSAETDLPGHAAVRRTDTRGAGYAAAVLPAGSTTRVATGAAPGQTVLGTLTSAGATGAGYATVYPCDAPRPLASNLNTAAGRNVANTAAVTVGASGSICVYASAGTHIIWDQAAEAGLASHSPARLVDTRTG